MAKYLDQSGLTYFWGKVKTEINKKLTATSSDKTKWDTAATNAVHSNREVLDDITAVKVEGWESAAATATHSNRTTLDLITAEKFNSWDAAATASGHTNRSVLDGITATTVSNANNGGSLYNTLSANATTLKAITATVKTGYDNAKTTADTLSPLKSNVAVLKGITQANIDSWSGGGTSAHSHSNKSTLDKITSGDVTKLQALYTKAQIDTTFATKNDIVSLYKPQGRISKADFEDLTPSASLLGYVYNVTEALTISDLFVEGVNSSDTGDSAYIGKTIPAGSNIVCIQIGSTYRWDILGGVIDLSPYLKRADVGAITNSEIDSIFA